MHLFIVNDNVIGSLVAIIREIFHRNVGVALKRAFWLIDSSSARGGRQSYLDVVVYFELVYFVTALVPSDTACLASSPGSRRRTAVWISRLVIVERLL